MITEGSQLGEAYWPTDTSQPVMETTVGGVLQAAAEAAPGRTGLVFAQPGDPVRRRWTFASLLTESERAAAALLARFDPGERIAVWAPNCPEWLLLEFGAALAGLTLVTVNPALRPRELLHILGNSKTAGSSSPPSTGVHLWRRRWRRSGPGFPRCGMQCGCQSGSGS